MYQLLLATKSYGYRCLLLVIMLCMFGCSSQTGVLTEERISETTELPTMTPSPTKIPMIPTGASTPIFTSVVEPTAIPFIILTTIPSITSTTMPIPTITGIDVEKLFQNFMTTNRDCELPCWWGFELGNSLKSVTQTFTNLGMPWLEIGTSSKVTSDQMGIWDASYYDQYEGYVVARLSVEIQFHELDGSIEYIYVFVNRVKFEESQQEFIRDWEQYFLSSFLQRYGKPTQVYFRLRTVADVMDPPQFSVSLLYREKGLAITYHIIGRWLQNQDVQAEFCLGIESVQAIELSLFNPEGFERWGYNFVPYHDELYEPLTWEAKFGVPLDTFYEMYQYPENSSCLTLSPG